MKKKFLVVAAFLMTMCSIEAFGWGIGVEAGLPLIGGLPGNNAMLSLKLDNMPMLGIGVGGIGSNLSVGVIADWWLIKQHIAGPLDIYVGPGAYLGFTTGNNATVSLGARLPIGLQVFIFKWFELFVEVAPGLGVTFSNPAAFNWNIQGGAGLRFWF